MKYINENIKNTVRVFPEQGRYNYKRYDMNENPEGLPKEFVQEVLSEITPEYLAIYPEPDKFVKKYAKFVNVNPENILTTNGSDMAIRYILETFGEPGKEVLTVSPSFEMYWVNCCILGLKHKAISYEPDFTIDVAKIIDAIGKDTRIVVLLNPNNPMGDIYERDEAEKIIKKAQEVGAMVIVDEAYHYFCKSSFIDLIDKYDNIVLLRTFSKMLSLAACRLGVVISQPENINYIRNGRLTFDVNSIALLFAEKLIERPEVIQQLITSADEGKEYFYQELDANGYEYIKCMGNFVLIKTKCFSKDVVSDLKNRENILVHGYGNNLLSEYIRVSTGSREAMKIFMEAFLRVDKK